MIGGARKYIYPLKHSKHHIVLISTTLFVSIVVIFFVYCMLALYKFQSTSSLLYDVTRVVPFPVAKAGPNYVSYESYLFELRHYIHYYQSQVQVNFGDQSGQEQLSSYKKQALQQVIDDAYVQQLANKYHVSVSSSEVNDEVSLVQNENRLGSNQKELENVLSEFWGWTLSDFKRELKLELLAQKVASKLDVSTNQEAQAVLAKLQQGGNFSKLAAQYSDDSSTKSNGGQFTVNTSQPSPNLPPQTMRTLENLQPGQISGVIYIGNALEIDKVVSRKGSNIQAAHILFNINSINTYVSPLEKSETPHVYIKHST